MSEEEDSKLENEIISDEGIIYKIYLDHLGYKTFGVGHLVKSNDPETDYDVGTEVSRDRVFECLEKDLITAKGDCRSLFKEENFDSWPVEVQHILINMVFNLGRTRLSKFKRMRAALEIGDWQEAAKEGRDSRWHRQVSNRAERLMKRLESLNTS